jgi:hypothetical protein
MPEVRHGMISPIFTEAGEIVFLPAVPDEDFSKRERIKGESEYFQIDNQTIGFISEALKHKDLVPGRNLKETFLRCFLRGAKKEFDLDFSNEQLELNLHGLGIIEQIRRSKEVIFLVKMFATVVLTDQQLSHLDNTVSKIEVVQPSQLKQFVESNKQHIRPAALLASQKVIELQQQNS